MAKTTAAKRYLRRFFSVMLGYVAAVFGASTIVRIYHPTGLPLIALSLLPGLAIVGALIVIGLYLVEETDEYLRSRIVTAMLFAIGVVLSASAVLGFLQIYGVIGKVDVFWAFPLWCAVWGLAQCAMVLRDYKGASQ